MQRDLVVILYDSIYNQCKIVKCKIANIINPRISAGNNFVSIYISLSVGVWWHVGNTKLLKQTHFYELQCLAS